MEVEAWATDEGEKLRRGRQEATSDEGDKRRRRGDKEEEEEEGLPAEVGIWVFDPGGSAQA